MLKRERVLSHPLSGAVDLPLLVPSFSSKGFTFFEDGPRNRRREYSEVTNALESVSSFISESIMVSAYDLFHQHFRQPVNHLKNTALVFIDSGFYELSPTFDSSEPKAYPHKVKEFTEGNYDSEITKLSKHSLPLVITNYDWGSRGTPFADQIQHAQHFFNRHKDCLTSFIVKPHKRNGMLVDVDDLIPDLAKLKAFDIVGIAEEELGKNLVDRLKRIARLRSEMNKRHMTAPIHIWGGIDPVMTPLYFFAGADIFDGISWMRYSYHKGLAVNRQCFAVLKGNLSTPHAHAIGLSMNENLMELQRLATNLRAFMDSGFNKFDVFDYNGDVLKTAWVQMMAKIDELKGGG